MVNFDWELFSIIFVGFFILFFISKKEGRMGKELGFVLEWFLVL